MYIYICMYVYMYVFIENIYRCGGGCRGRSSRARRTRIGTSAPRLSAWPATSEVALTGTPRANALNQREGPRWFHFRLEEGLATTW